MLAGEGVTPSPAGRGAPRASGAAAAAAALAVQQTPRTVRRGTAASASPRVAAVQSRSSSRAGSSSRLQQGLAAPLKRAESARVPDGQAARADKAVSRQASAWEQQQERQERQAAAAEQQQLDCGDRAGSHDGLISAEPSPTRALVRLQEQRRQQQGSRLAVPVRQQGDEAAVQLGGQQAQHGHGLLDLPPSLQQQERQQAQHGHGLLDLAPSLQQQERQQPKVHLQLSGAADAAGAAKMAATAQVLPVRDGRLMQLYSLVLDEQISLLESDLAQLSGAPSPIAQLQKAASAAAAAGKLLPGKAAPAAGKQDGVDGGQRIDAPASQAVQQKPQEQQLQKQQQREGTIAAWRPNGAFVPESVAEPDAAAMAAPARNGTRGMQQLMSPGGGTPGAAGQAVAASAAPGGR